MKSELQALTDVANAAETLLHEVRFFIRVVPADAKEPLDTALARLEVAIEDLHLCERTEP